MTEPCVSNYTFELVTMGAVLFFLLLGALVFIGQTIQHARRWRRFVDVVGGEEMAEANIEQCERDNAAIARAAFDAFKRNELSLAERRAKFGEDCW